MTEGNGEARELPKGWVSIQHKEIADINPKLPMNDLQDNLEVSFLPMAAVEERSGRYRLNETREYGKVKKGYTPVMDGDVIFAKITPCMENGKVAIVDKLKNGIGFGSTEFHVSRLSEFIDKNYIFYYFNQETFRRNAQRHMTGSAGQLRVPKSYFEEVEIPLAPSNEQKRIVEKIEELFSELDQGIENLKTAQKQLKVYRQAVLKWAFEGKLTEQWRQQAQQQGTLTTGEELLAQIKAERENRYQQQVAEWEAAVKTWEAIGKPGKKPSKPSKPKDLPPLTSAELAELPQLPDRWCWVQLHGISQTITDGDHQPPPKADEGVPFIVISNIQNNKIDFSDTKFVPIRYYKNIQDSRKPRRNDILYTVTGSFGIPCLIDFDSEFCFQRHIGLIRLETVIVKKFVFYFLQSSFAYQQAIKVSTGTAQKTVPLAGLREFKVPFPSCTEQEEIVQEIESRLSNCDQLENTIVENLQKAEALRQSILKQAFEGKLVPQDPNDEPAEKLLERIRADKENKLRDVQSSKRR